MDLHLEKKSFHILRMVCVKKVEIVPVVLEKKKENVKQFSMTTATIGIPIRISHMHEPLTQANSLKFDK